MTLFGFTADFVRAALLLFFGFAARVDGVAARGAVEGTEVVETLVSG